MTPYARSILKFLSFSFVLGAIGQVYALYMKLAMPPVLFWSAAAVLVLAGIVIAFYKAVGELRAKAGFYRPVRSLRRDAKRTFEDLGVKRYFDFYFEREDDKTVRSRLKAKGGVLVTGRPLAGKTRAAVEAIIATFPNAYLLRIDPGNFESEAIDALIVPCPFVFFGKPEVVVLFDNVDMLDAGLIEKLLARLTEQTSAVYAVSTCDAGAKEQRLGLLRGIARGYMFEAVALGALPAVGSSAILNAVWQGKAYPVISDISLPGYVVLGSNPVLGKIRTLPEQDRKAMQALRLAAGCGALDCDEKLFWGILEDVLSVRPASREALLDRLGVEGAILVQHPSGSAKRIAAQHTSYLDDAYSDLPSFNVDFARLADWLYDKRDVQHLASVAAHYWIVVLDSQSARKVYEKLVGLGAPDPVHLLSLAALYVAFGETAREEETLTRALGLAQSPGEQAQFLVSYGDVLLYRLARPADSMNAYNRAYQLISSGGEEKLLDLIRRRSGDNLLIGHRYADAEPYFRGWLAGAKGDDALDACERVALSLVGQGSDMAAKELLRERWAPLARGVRIERAMQLLDDAEGCLADEPLTAAGGVAFECLVAPTKTSADLKRQTEELIEFGYQALCRGFVRASVLAHSHLAALPEAAMGKADQAAVRINLGLSLCLLGDNVAARRAFERTRSIAESDVKTAMFAAGAEAGLGDVSLRIGQTGEAKEHYRRALRVAEAAQDTNMINWAHLGLGEAAIVEQDFAEAERLLVKLDRIIDSYQQYLRIWLGLAQVHMHFKRWVEADAFLSRALALKRRHDFAAVHVELQKLRDTIAKRQAAGSVDAKVA